MTYQRAHHKATAGARWRSAETVYRSLMARRIFVRWFDEGGLRDEPRVSIGTPEETGSFWKLSGCWAGRRDGLAGAARVRHSSFDLPASEPVQSRMISLKLLRGLGRLIH